jgi:hypothetical protein
MKVTWSDLSAEEQATFGNGCTWVPDFIFTASCRQHDLNYTRGGYLFAKIKADYDMCSRMFHDALCSKHPWFFGCISILYFSGLTLLPFSYILFIWGRWRTKEEILSLDEKHKKRRGIMCL